MREKSSKNCPFVDELLKAICRGDVEALSQLFGQSGAYRLIKLYGDLTIHQQQLFIVLLPSAVVRELQHFRGNSKSATHIASAVGKTLIQARASDYDSIVVNHVSGTMDGVNQTLLPVDG